MRVFEYIPISRTQPNYIQYIFFDDDQIFGFCFDKKIKPHSKSLLREQHMILNVESKYTGWIEITDSHTINMIKVKYL